MHILVRILIGLALVAIHSFLIIVIVKRINSYCRDRQKNEASCECQNAFFPRFLIVMECLAILLTIFLATKI